MNLQPTLTEIVQVAQDLRDSHAVHMSTDPLRFRIVALDDSHEPLELCEQHAQRFFSKFFNLKCQHRDALEKQDALLYLAKPYIDAMRPPESSEPLQENSVPDLIIPPTNVEIVTDLMQLSRHGAVAQSFVLDALRKRANEVASLSQEELLTAMQGSEIPPAAWQGAAIEIRDTLNAHFANYPA